jgi:asparagine synthase (glutamine-hydrolysing)
MNGRLPAAVLGRKKVGFDIPAHQWLRGPLRPILEDALSFGLAEYDALFSRRAVESCLDRHLSRRANVGYHLWGLMILFLWMKRWHVQTNAPAEPQPWLAESASIAM